MSTGSSKLWSPAEAGRVLGGISASSVKRVAAEIGIAPMLTVSGARLFTAEQVEKIKQERERRAREAGR